ncbi:hypothetical protein COW36_03870 [bacterium (Candidatus Blackallbacteria) CG17_big_fil_post_rev_8_21_14_2_50_48_46]|uniref:Transglycosylase SLT domain-containing protein n=1 Tax=bacterium (Candidatus Blackallbacteria) CG17_big_fil_post_rev_8_21_14_2_50_48_46 TaxID=2014261 RepID=A0A2M7G8K2_9BACT|nr:MAG: hypothetical protein COW64_05075 [bacterium (Candidatus Blackallbacteria) CG18_big_fil_WC_8_21_14_2_50_49_26]PIW18437.1 MAG: hypothetical protein COW36_03870 [bacterium (Candidatus Blackallbacteria) CG17_big_fil_post_rev_8_21_14_2_50_48_46]PIW46578.1 MAG: hypothetical protein COW20_16810 [bacterium (Candidatus Blackallbacteria) CG13_big_fil_rev_8_21_14_2_50_49_14]
MLRPLQIPQPGLAMIQTQSVSRMLGVSASVQSQNTGTGSRDQFQLMHPSLLMQRSATPISVPPVSFSSPTQQLQYLGQKYGVVQTGSLSQFQTEVIKAVIRVKAREHGIPEKVALGIAGNESGWKMWSNLEKGTVIQGKNIRDGELKSTDWGVMQINDKAHGSARVFPRAKYDLEFNIDYGLSFLARQRQKIKGDLGLGLGDWDRTVASYNLGHDPQTSKSLAIAQNYVSHVSNKTQYA